MSEGMPLLPTSQRQLADLRCKPDVVADRRIVVVALACPDAVVAHWCTLCRSVILDGPLCTMCVSVVLDGSPMHPRCRRVTAVVAGQVDVHSECCGARRFPGCGDRRQG